MFLELMSRLPRAAAQVFLEMSRQGLATNQAYLMVAGQPEADQAWKEAQRLRLQELSVVVLKERLRALDLKVSGRKADLVDRLLDVEGKQ